MGVHSHDNGLTRRNEQGEFGRPPWEAAPPGQLGDCQGYVIGGIPCGFRPHWLVPEVLFCAHHLPDHLIVLANERRKLWVELAAEAWQHVLATLPISQDEDSRDRADGPVPAR